MSYCFRYQKSEKYFSNQSLWSMDGVMNSPCLDVLTMVGLNGFTNGLPIFIPINKLTLLTDIKRQCGEPPEKIIFILENTTPPEEPFISNVKRLKDLGFGMALECIRNYDEMHSIIELCDYFFINCQNPQYKEDSLRLTHRYKNISLIASDVNDMDLFDRIKYDRFGKFNFFEGRFYSVASTKSRNTIAPIKVNRIQLLNIIREEDFDIDRLVKVVKQDPALSISLLKFVNLSYVKSTHKIKTIQHAVAMLGQKEVKKWVTTAASGLLADDKPNEITKLSLMRAKFAENLSNHFELGIHSHSLFLMGLFSILDVILEIPMTEALKVVIVSDKIYNALVNNEGDFAAMLHFIYKYEEAEWNEVFRLMILHNLNAEDIFNAYIEAVRWYGSIISANIETEQQ